MLPCIAQKHPCFTPKRPCFINKTVRACANMPAATWDRTLSPKFHVKRQRRNNAWLVAKSANYMLVHLRDPDAPPQWFGNRRNRYFFFFGLTYNTRLCSWMV
jgi:hypothetical protein